MDTISDFYNNMDKLLKQDGRASLKDVLLFTPKYMRSLWISLHRCFYRQLWIDKTMFALRACQKEVAEEMQKLASSSNTSARQMAERRYRHWQLVEDQFSWYHCHSLVLVDVLSLMTARDDRMSRVVRLWKALDDALSSVLPRPMFPRLWKPTPSVRRQSLLARWGNVSSLAAGGELRDGSLREEGLEPSLCGEQRDHVDCREP